MTMSGIRVERTEARGEEVSLEERVATLTEANGWDIIRAKEIVAAVVEKKGRLKPRVKKAGDAI